MPGDRGNARTQTGGELLVLEERAGTGECEISIAVGNVIRGSITHAYPLCHCDPVLDTGVGNLVAVATAVCRGVFNLIEIATWFDRLTMSG